MIRPKAFLLTALLLLFWAPSARAALQFDVFVGYEGNIHEAGWFPVTCEIFNDGPSFNAVIEVVGGQFGSDQTRQVPIELPTNTRKRLVIPMFASGGRFNVQWNARLLSTEGKPIQERLDIPSKPVSWNSIIFGAVPRNFGGTPVLPEMKQNRQDLKPEVARIQTDQFPDNPIVLEGLDLLYLNSEKALDLKVPQVTALLGWVRSGGHLILAVEQLADVNATPWLKSFVPIDLVDTTNTPIDGAITTWIKSPISAVEEESFQFNLRPGNYTAQAGNSYENISLDDSLKGATMPVASGTLRDGVILFSNEGTPLAVQAPRGRGKITVLTFSPEREPFRSWKSRDFFWSRLAGIQADFFTGNEQPNYGSWSSDGIFGALIDSRQIKKLPVTWLLLLLVVYLVVIGPFDQWWLKKINRQMLTWITFPAYVVLFSLLIYFIGYKLRAGETEWNELNIVDLLPRGDKVDLRGHTYISIYSSENAWHPVKGQDGYATIRGELADLYGGGRDGSKARVIHTGNSFNAEVYVPVWSSLLFANEWFKTNDTPFVAAVTYTGTDYQVDLENLLPKPLTDLRLVVNQLVFELEPLAARERKTVRLQIANGKSLRDFVQSNATHFQRAVELRRNPLGDTSGSHLEDRPLTATVTSFISYLDQFAQGGRQFITPSGLDLTHLVDRGDAIIFAWAEGFSFSEKINQFQPRRFKQDTLLRLSVPVQRPNNPS